MKKRSWGEGKDQLALQRAGRTKRFFSRNDKKGTQRGDESFARKAGALRSGRLLMNGEGLLKVKEGKKERRNTPSETQRNRTRGKKGGIPLFLCGEGKKKGPIAADLKPRRSLTRSREKGKKFTPRVSLFGERGGQELRLGQRAQERYSERGGDDHLLRDRRPTST